MAKNSNSKKYPIGFYAIAFIIPFLFFLLLEGLLVLINYGQDYPYWEPVSADFPDKKTLNYNITKKYFKNLTGNPNPWVDGFDIEKKDNAFRVFVLGGSSGAGYPFELNAAFSREIKRRLQLLYPDIYFEVINLSISAINSYTLADFSKGVINEDPDLILIYAGHNEFYGALGVGSAESLGGFPQIISLIIELESIKTVQLIRNSISGFLSLFESKDSFEGKKTLMERIVDNQKIPLHSATYQNGLFQFKYNLEKIIRLFSDQNVPVITGSLVSNLKDLRPFISEAADTLPAASTVFDQATTTFSRGDIEGARAQYVYAKDLDLLRFRAPDEFNTIIEQVSNAYNVPVVNLDSVFNANASQSIPGYDLFVDHLHPTRHGYRLMGKAYFDQILKSGLLPAPDPAIYNHIDGLADRAIPFTRFDTIYADLKLIRLFEGWPFNGKNIPPRFQDFVIDTTDYVTKFAKQVIEENLSWERAHVALMMAYKKNKNIPLFLKEVDCLVDFTDYNTSALEIASQFLIEEGQTRLAFKYLTDLHKLSPSAYTNKWMATILLNEGQPLRSLPFFEEAVKLNPKDAQLLYNYAGAHVIIKDYKKAYEIIQQCLAVDPKFDGADIMFKQLQAAIR